jgi:hypothetical protein
MKVFVAGATGSSLHGRNRVARTLLNRVKLGARIPGAAIRRTEGGARSPPARRRRSADRRMGARDRRRSDPKSELNSQPGEARPSRAGRGSQHAAALHSAARLTRIKRPTAEAGAARPCQFFRMAPGEHESPGALGFGARVNPGGLAEWPVVQAKRSEQRPRNADPTRGLSPSGRRSRWRSASCPPEAVGRAWRAEHPTPLRSTK